MATKRIDEQRIAVLNDAAAGGGQYVLYWMQRSQRAEMNHALEFAVQRANEWTLPLLVCCVLEDEGPIALTDRRLTFMLEGLQEVASTLRQRNIALVVRTGKAVETVTELAGGASEVICDRGYLRHHVRSRQQLARAIDCRLWQIESDVIVPVEAASKKREYAARTIRSQLNRTAAEFLHPLTTTPLEADSGDLGISGVDLSDLWSACDRFSSDSSVPAVDWISGGTRHAKARLKSFLNQHLEQYPDRSDVLQEHVSHLSPYLHYGQISPLAIHLAVQQASADQQAKDEFFEELLVRRELAYNFVHYEPRYDSLEALPSWARETLDEHESDARSHHYTASELENARTHDEGWNAMMMEMKQRGYLHNHLRMYWGKKFIEWTRTVNHAYHVAIDLNNKYFLDGWDPNSFANVMWLFGLHDRAFGEREVYGKVRYMSANGLRRKFDLDRYIAQVTQTVG
jgi:deoxyribodipyrimidine photo-lyase